MRRLIAALLLSLVPAMAPAQQAPSAAKTAIPSDTPDGLFGFMDDSTIVGVGKSKLKYQFLPTSGGGMASWGEKLQFSYGATDDLLVGIAAEYQPNDGPPPNGRSQVWTASLPLQYVFVQRIQNGTGFALSTTASVSQTSTPHLPGTKAWSLDNHFIIDHDFDGTYFIGTNIGYTAGATDWARSPNGTLYVQAGGTIKFSPHFYWGMQVQLSQALNGFFANQAGWAGFVSTSVSIPMASSWTISGAFMRQIVGGDDANPAARLNTRNFSLNQGKVALAFVF